MFLTGVPGSGKTLVGLQLAHARWLERLAVPRAGGRATIPAVYLSGNQPLVLVLQHALRSAGGGGRTFVQLIKNYVANFSKYENAIPPEHLIVFDEAQRAFDAQRVAHVHKQAVGGSEPEHLLRFLRRVPDWCVLVALIGSGQAIHQGEEGGLPLWREALKAIGGGWTVHGAQAAESAFAGAGIDARWNPTLNLDTEIRHHLVPHVHRWVELLLDMASPEDASGVATGLASGAHTLLVTRDIEAAKAYLKERYSDSPQARYGIIASSRDKALVGHGVDNSFHTTKFLQPGPWFNDAKSDPRSCCQLQTVATEFAVQGLELDMALLAWGTDLRRRAGVWTDEAARRHKVRVQDSLALRRNAYRVLLTRGRDGTIIFVPRESVLDETYDYLVAAGARPYVGENLPPHDHAARASSD